MDKKNRELGVLEALAQEIHEGFSAKRSLLSFEEFFELFRANPQRHCRSVAQYIRDMMDYFGTRQVDTPKGPMRRFKVFDMEQNGGRFRVVGNEQAQNELYHLLGNFIQERRITRMVLLHGPNGSAKSSFIHCLIAGLEAYSHTEEGALYRFNWVFPSSKMEPSNIGFSRRRLSPSAKLESYAHLAENEIDAKLIEELRDNPLLLLPKEQRQRMLLELFGNDCRDSGGNSPFVLSDAIFDGDISHKSRLIFDALLSSYEGDYNEVLRHVQVERFYISLRYRQSAVSVEPQMRVDAGSRQVTADRSLSALPTALQNRTLFEPFGELVDGNRGIVEFNDMLKRHPDLNKYLIATVEKGTVAVDHAILFIDAVLLGSSNEDYLEAFKAQPDYPSFKGRLDLVRMPYLLDYRVEREIYDELLAHTVLPKHVAPHSTHIAALWAVLTRMMKPSGEGRPEKLKALLDELSPLEKADFYANARMPEELGAEDLRTLREALVELSEAEPDVLQYEGRYGISPREMKNVLLRAAQLDDFACLSPLALFDELKRVVRDPTIHPFLRIKPEGGYHDPAKFIAIAEERYLDLADAQLRSSVGLLDESGYEGHFARYVNTVSNWLKGEKMFNRLTQQYEPASESFMHEIESRLGITEDAKSFREQLISTVAAYRIDNPQAEMVYAKIFPEQLDALQSRDYEERKAQIRHITEDVLAYLDGEGQSLSSEEREQVEETLRALEQRFGYCRACAKETLSLLRARRY